MVGSMKSNNLRVKIKDLLANDPGLSVKAIAEKLGLNRVYVAGFLKALELEGFIRSKQIGPARVYFLEKASNPKKER